MNKTLLLLVLIILFASPSFSQVIFQEDFEAGNIPAEWTIETNATDGGWLVNTPNALSSQYFSIQENGSSRIAATNDDNCNCDKSNESFNTPAIDLTNIENAILSFDAYFLDETYQGAQENATVEISIDNENWVILEDLHGHASWDQHTISLNDYVGNVIYLKFRYDDGGDWLYGFAIDNVEVSVPAELEAELVEINSRPFGEVNTAIPIEGTLFNGGSNEITSLEISYTIDGGDEVTEVLEDLAIAPFTYQNFSLSADWLPMAPGTYELAVNISLVNGQIDENINNNAQSFESQIFDLVIAPNVIEGIVMGSPLITEIASSSDGLDKPTDLDFFPILGKDELWIVNERIADTGGSTVTISNATNPENREFWTRVDGNAWHFMSLPTGIAFSDDNFNFATSPGIQDANHNGGSFTGPTLWSSDPEIYAQPSGGNGSHLDMLHGSPFSMGIAHEVDNVFWIYDDWNEDIVRYNFVEDHGPGNDDHSDAIVRRFQNIGIEKDGDIPNHMILDKSTDWLYFVDNGNDRVIRLDINSGTSSNAIPLINEPLAEHSGIFGFNFETIIDSGLDQPCGIEIIDNLLLVGDYANGDIIVYDMNNDFAEVGRISTGEPGLTGIKIGPEGKVWYTNRLQNTLNTIEAGDPVNTNQLSYLQTIISPNPTSGPLSIQLPNSINLETVNCSIHDMSGKQISTFNKYQVEKGLDLSFLPNGIYLLKIKSNKGLNTHKVIIEK